MSDTSRTPPGRLGLGALVRAVVSFGILAALLWWLPTDRLLGAISRVPGWVWGVVVVGFAAGHAVSALKWRVLLGATSVPVPIGEALRAHAAGLFANLCLPSLVGGDVVRAGLVAHSQRGLERVAMASLADRVIDTFTLLLLAGGAVLIVPTLPDVPVMRALAVVAVALPVGVVIGVVVLLRMPIDRLPERLARIGDRFRSALRGLLDNRRAAGTAFLLSLCVQSGFVLLNVLIARAMEIDQPTTVWFLVWPLAKIVALAPVSLGGIGVRELGLAALLAPFGVPSSVAVAQSLCWEAVLVATGLVAGAVALWTGARLPFLSRRPPSALEHLDNGGAQP